MLLLKLGDDESAWLVQTTQLLLVESKVQRLQVTSKLVCLKIHLQFALLNLLLYQVSFVSDTRLKLPTLLHYFLQSSSLLFIEFKLLPV